MPATSPSGPVEHQSFQPFPQLGTPFVDSDGHLDHAWYRLLISMWNKLGKTLSQAANAVFIQQTATDAGAPLSVFSSVDGSFIGEIFLQDQKGAPAVPVDVGLISPFVFSAAASGGTLIVFGAQVEMSRDLGVTWYLATLQGGPIPLLLGDSARLTWFGPTAPPTVFFPIS